MGRVIQVYHVIAVYIRTQSAEEIKFKIEPWVKSLRDLASAAEAVSFSALHPWN